MAWTAPMTAIAGSVFTAAQFNTFLRDNLAETAPAKATTPGSFFVTSDVNQISERIPQQNTINISDTTTSTSFVDLANPGPSVTVTTGSRALYFWSAEVHTSTASEAGRVGIDISGATTEAPNNNHVLRQESSGTGEFNRCSCARMHITLTPGSNTFKMMYCVTGTTTGSFNFRDLIVVPF